MNAPPLSLINSEVTEFNIRSSLRARLSEAKLITTFCCGFADVSSHLYEESKSTG